MPLPYALRHALTCWHVAKRRAYTSALITRACYLERGPQLPLNLRQGDPLIRQLTPYRDLIQARTEQESTTLNESTP